MKFNPDGLLSTLSMFMLAIFIGKMVHAVPVPHLYVTGLYNQSDIVVIGKAQNISIQKATTIDWNGSQISGRLMSVQVSVDKIIKGEKSLPTVSFVFFQPDDFLGFKSITKGQYGMFFLKRSSATMISVTNPYYPSIISLADPIQTKETGLSRLAQELGLVLNSLKTTTAEKILALKALETVDVISVNALLREAFSSPNEQLKLYIASALIKRGDVSQLAYAIAALLQSPPAKQDELLQLALSIESGVHSSDSLPLLINGLKVKNPQFRRAIAESIRSTKVDTAVHPLSTLLFDSDPEIRYVAVIGLAEITGQYDWGPAQDVFLSNERRYLEYWKNWSKLR